MSPPWNSPEEEEDLTVIEEKKSEEVSDFSDQTVPYTRKQDLAERWEDLTPSYPFLATAKFPFHPALPRDRFAAFFIDAVLIAYAWFGTGFLFEKLVLQNPTLFALIPWQTGLRLAGLSIATLLYFVICESTGGATLGKLLCRLRVVNLDGNTPLLANVFLRNLCRLFDYPLAGLVAILSMESSHFYQTLGDRAARTIVVKKTRKHLKPIDLRTAPLCSTFVRMTAFIIDGLIYILFISLFLGSLNPNSASFKWLSSLFPLWAGGYFLIFEFLISTTPGKFLLGRMSVLDNGEPLDATATLLRNLVRPIDILMGYPLLALSRKKQRLGDMIADTLVIKHRQKRKGGLALGILAVLLLGMGYLTYQNSNRFWFSSKLNFKLPALQPSLHKTTTPSPTPSTPNRNVRENEKITEIKIPPTAPATQLPKPQSTSSLLKVTQFAFSGPELIPMGNNPVFNRGDLMFVFFTLEGFQKEENGQANIVEDIQLIGPDGELVAAQSNVADFNEVVPQGSPSLQFANQLKLSNTLSTGTYNFILIAKDNLNGGQLVYEKQFRVR